MKRSELVVGTDYVTDSALRVTVRDTEPGWVVKDGKPERDKTSGVRFMSGKQEQSEYLANVNILVDWTRSDGSVVPLALAPRALRATWAQYESLTVAMRPEMLKYGWEGFSKRRTDIEGDSADRKALISNWKRRIKDVGVTTNVELSKDGTNVTVPAAALHKILTKAGA